MIIISCPLRGLAFYMTLVVLMVFSAENLVAGGMAPVIDPDLLFQSESNKPIGHIAWEITETSSGKTLGSGNRDLFLKDVQIISDGDEDGYIEQRIPLSDGFYVKLNSGRNKGPFTGFGMAAGKADRTTFCWEWFTVSDMVFAEKLQEKGKLLFESREIGDYYEVTRTRFLTDISMRVEDAQYLGDTDRPPDWRVRILKRSDIRWPTCIDGQVLLGKDAVAWRIAHPGFWESLVQAAHEETSATKTHQ